MNKEPCVYRITCKGSGKVYFGSTLYFTRRKKRHLYDLLKNRHCNSYLQRTYDKYGPESLVFEVVELVHAGEDLRTREEWFIASVDRTKSLNLMMTATGGDTISGHPDRAAIIAKRSASLKITTEALGPEGRRLVFSRDWWVGKHHSESTKIISREKGKIGAAIRKEQMLGKSFEQLYGPERAASIKAKLSAAVSRNVTGSGNPFFGKKHTPESVAKMRASHLGVPNTTQRKTVEIDGVSYQSLTEAANQMGIPPATICYRLKSPHFTNYRYLRSTQ